MPKVNLPQTPLYDPKTVVQNFRFEEDFENIRFNALGQGCIFKDPHFLYYLDEDKEWRRPKEICGSPVFIDGKPERFDALQGHLGNCWLMAAVEAITLNEKLIQHVVPSDQSFGRDYIGAFHFRIWQLGVWYDVVVDDRLPVFKKDKKLCFAHSMKGNVFWAALLEKAYAKVCGTTTISFEGLTAGNTMTSLQDLTGGLVEKVQTRPPTELKWLMNEVHSKNALMVGACVKKDSGLHDKHSYSVTNVFKADDNDPDYRGLFLVRIMNPWGLKEWQGAWSDKDYDHWEPFDREIRKRLGFVIRDDGEFWMTDRDFIEHFSNISICHLGPGQYMARRRGTEFKTWRTSSFTGEWVRRVSAGGAAKANRHKNPQFRIVLDWPENDTNKDGKCEVVIELVHRSKFGRELRPDIVFYIYLLPNRENYPVPLDQAFFDKNDPVDKSPDFSASKGRAYLQSMVLFPGTYCIVPCTLKENVESQFLLRVFSESTVDLWEYDKRISKSLPTEESLNEPNQRLQRRFDEVAQGEGEIDWIGFKEILDTEMNRDRSNKMRASFLNFIGNIFEKFISIWSNNSEADDVFTKEDCRSMIAMLDDNHSGKLSFSEFSTLWSKICFWTGVYENHRDEREGLMTVGRLRDALSSIGYDINTRAVHSLSYVYANEDGNVSLTDFILCGVALETVLELREKKYAQAPDGDKTTFTLEEWVKNTLVL